jgi:hypothetical protein
MSELLETPEIRSVPEADESPLIKPINLWKPSQFLGWSEPPGNHLLQPAYLTKGGLTSLIGQGGLEHFHESCSVSGM